MNKKKRKAMPENARYLTAGVVLGAALSFFASITVASIYFMRELVAQGNLPSGIDILTFIISLAFFLFFLIGNRWIIESIVSEEKSGPKWSEHKAFAPYKKGE